MQTHLVFFNPSAPRHLFYERLLGLLGAEPASDADCREQVQRSIGLSPAGEPAEDAIAVGVGCSSSSPERRFDPDQWATVFRERLRAQPELRARAFRFLGAADEAPIASDVIARLRQDGFAGPLANLCGALDLAASLRALAAAPRVLGHRLRAAPLRAPVRPAHRLVLGTHVSVGAAPPRVDRRRDPLPGHSLLAVRARDGARTMRGPQFVHGEPRPAAVKGRVARDRSGRDERLQAAEPVSWDRALGWVARLALVRGARRFRLRLDALRLPLGSGSAPRLGRRLRVAELPRRPRVPRRGFRADGRSAALRPPLEPRLGLGGHPSERRLHPLPAGARLRSHRGDRGAGRRACTPWRGFASCRCCTS